MLYKEAYEPALRRALDLAKQAQAAGDVPIGAVVLDSDGMVIGEGFNQREVAPFDPSAHAEIVALRQAAARRGSWCLDGCTLVVTLEPCAMCAGAIVNSRISRLVFAAWDDKAGACGSTRDIVRDERLNHRVEVISDISPKLHDRCVAMLRDFFAARRNTK